MPILLITISLFFYGVSSCILLLLVKRWFSFILCILSLLVFYFTYLFSYAYFFFPIFVFNSSFFLFLVFQYLFSSIFCLFSVLSYTILYTSNDNSLGSPILVLYSFSSISTLCLPLISIWARARVCSSIAKSCSTFQFLQLVAYLGNKTLA